MIPKPTEQLIVVTVPTWKDTRGKCLFLEKEGGEWKIFHSADCIIGRSGMAWGLGNHSLTEEMKNLKIEGDGKTPAGIFSIGTFFGFEKGSSFSFPYVCLNDNHYWVDDPDSIYYNQLIHLPEIEKPDWKSAEKMSSFSVYELGFFVEHNPENKKGKGSCIFFHLQSEDLSPTEGCTSLNGKDLVKLCQWLNPKKHPCIIQLPEEMYASERQFSPWNLPFFNLRHAHDQT